MSQLRLGFFVFKTLPAVVDFVLQIQEIVVILGYKKIILGDNTMTKEIWRDIDGYEGRYQAQLVALHCVYHRQFFVN